MHLYEVSTSAIFICFLTKEELHNKKLHEMKASRVILSLTHILHKLRHMPQHMI